MEHIIDTDARPLISNLMIDTTNSSTAPFLSHQKWVEEPKLVGWMICFLLMTSVVVCMLNLLLYTYHVL